MACDLIFPREYWLLGRTGHCSKVRSRPSAQELKEEQGVRTLGTRNLPHPSYSTVSGFILVNLLPGEQPLEEELLKAQPASLSIWSSTSQCQQPVNSHPFSLASHSKQGFSAAWILFLQNPVKGQASMSQGKGRQAKGELGFFCLPILTPCPGSGLSPHLPYTPTQNKSFIFPRASHAVL